MQARNNVPCATLPHKGPTCSLGTANTLSQVSRTWMSQFLLPLRFQGPCIEFLGRTVSPATPAFSLVLKGCHETERVPQQYPEHRSPTTKVALIGEFSVCNVNQNRAHKPPEMTAPGQAQVSGGSSGNGSFLLLLSCPLAVHHCFVAFLQF